jgi:tetratricopeptide (TPR) repeat protein
MDLTQHLVDRGSVRYEGGAWTLPSRLDAADLPASAEDAIRARLSDCGSLARWLAEAQAVASHRAFTRDDYARLRPDASAAAVEAAILDLVSHRIVASDGRVYTLVHRRFTAVLTAALSPADLAERHRALAALYEGRLTIGVVRHALLASLDARALDTLAPHVNETPEATTLFDVADIAAGELAATFADALDAAERLGRSPREINELRRWLASLSVASDDKYYWRAVPDWLEQLKKDSGYTAWLEHADVVEAGPRLSRAMQVTYERFIATPEAERVYRPDEAIRGLVRYVAISIAVGMSRMEGRILESLPELLEPFAPLSELVHAVWQNALATRESGCRIQPEQARARWIDVYDRLGRITGDDAQYADIIRHAVAYGLGSMEAWMGMQSAAKRADALDDDPMHQVTALYLRRVVRMQQGDWEGAERFRKQAEVRSLEARSRQMFTTITSVELSACTMARDITGLKQCGDKIRALAAAMPGWIPHVYLAEGRLALVCDNFADAIASFDKALALVEPNPDTPYPLHTAWCVSVAGKVEALIGLERFEEARAVAERTLALTERLEIGAPSHEIGRSLALALAKLGDTAAAIARLDGIIARQLELGISGLHLGASYEARARIAIWSGDEAGVEEYAKLTAREYRHGQGSPLGARYERLMAEARKAGKGALPGLSDFESSRLSSAIFARTSATVIVTQAMKGADGARERAERALGLLCHARAATAGYLYLFGERGVKLAALHGPPPPDGLSSFIDEYVEGELSESDVATEFVDENSSGREPERVRTFSDEHGLVYYPIILTATVDGGACFAGVAALALVDTPAAMDAELVAALGMHLLQAGDARALRV